MVIPRQWIPKRVRTSAAEARLSTAARDSREQFQRPNLTVTLFERMTTAQRQRAGRMSANNRLARMFAKKAK